jgi:hypothetical protein
MEFTHIANPVRVEAAVIVDVDITGPIPDCGVDIIVSLADGTQKDVHLSDEMVSRFIPGPGDYLVTQEDGYQYINPKAVFERKYRAIEPNEDFDTLALSLELSGHRSEVRTRDDRIAELEAENERLRDLEKANSWTNAAGLDARSLRHSVLLAMNPAGRAGLLKHVDEAVKYVMSGALPESK